MTIIKVAAQNFKQWMRPLQRNKKFMKQFVGLGAISGAMIGANSGFNTVYKKNKFTIGC